MTGTVKALLTFLAGAPICALVEVAEARGSTPRDKGTWMLVSSRGIFGTIGGGQLEYMAIDRARAMIAGALPSPLWGGSTGPAGQGGGGAGSGATVSAPTPALRADPPHRGEGEALLSVPLGPEIGQCCGGRVDVSIRMVDEAMKHELLAAAKTEEDRLPHLYVFGGGHVGHALASAFSLLPVRTIIVETRAEALEGMPDAVETRLTPVPEDVVRQAPNGSAFVVLTHDHALDFLIASEALNRTDAAYVGMIGSRTKKATFRTWFLKNAGRSAAAFSRLISPIGGDIVRDKRPAVIAALAAAEIIAALSRVTAQAGTEA